MSGIWKLKQSFVNPSEVVDDEEGSRDLVQGLIPRAGITWLYGPSMSFKSFIAMSIAAAVTKGEKWMGLEVDYGVVVYVGSEGGRALHLRRAAAELNAGTSGQDFAVVQERPQLDTVEGANALKGILHGILGMYDRSEKSAKATAAIDSPDFIEMCDRYDLGEKSFREENVLLIIDTYSQTSSGDDKNNVAAYMKTLRDIIDDAYMFGNMHMLSVLVVDHATKAGGSYLGSVSKLNDVDSQIEVVRDGDSRRVSVVQRKSKDGQEQPPIHLEMKDFVFEGKLNAYGQEKTTLVVRNGDRAAALAAIAASKAGHMLMLDLLGAAGGAMPVSELRALFYAAPEYEGARKGTATKAFKRAKDDLVQDNLVVFEGNDARLTES